MKTLFFVACFFGSAIGWAQVINTAVIDTASMEIKGKFSVQGYIDTYFMYDFSRPAGKEKPYFVSSARHNEMTINLAYIDLKYTSQSVRGRFVPALGSYINANYANEDGALKYVIEASAGVKLFKNKEIWVDAGVFGSPYTNESAISKDHLCYSRSFAPEYVPYYLSGVKISVPLSPKINAFLYLLNGWQLIKDNNDSKSIGTQIEYRPNAHLLINWNTYIGNEKSDLRPDFGNRYFSDIFLIYNKGKFSATSCVYAGIQEQIIMAEKENLFWWNANAIVRYQIKPKLALAGRLEYFKDTKGVQIQAITGKAFETASSTLGLHLSPADNMLIRFELRNFWSPNEVYFDDKQQNTTQNTTVYSNFTIWF
jgi:Putative beta-barrel porin-2, OmpL-like. bbp2